MPAKKSAKPEESAAEQELEHRVDAIMSTEPSGIESAVSAAPVIKKATAEKPAVKPSDDQKTAPPLPAKLLKNVKPDKAPESEEPKPEAPAEPPLVITLADEAETPPKPVDQDAPDTEADTATGPELPAETEWAQDPDPEDNLLENSDTDKAVDQIVAKESDAVLALDDALAARKERLSSPVQASGTRHKWLWFLGFIIVVGTVVDYLIFKSH